ncbi:hypothetical protein MKX07_007849 [Trichoderma sp. CBMAI-0711]|nr:hypothetical protein MKX07_007849 [Trichoderma sp. CBMAI-0711]
MHLIDFTKFANIVDGTRRSSESFYTGTNAATGSSLWQTPVATSQDVEDAVVAARKAFGSWAAKTYKDRTELLERFADIFLAHANQFIELLAKYEIPEKRQEDETKYTIVRYEPLGVVAAICPWNFPLMLAAGLWFNAGQICLASRRLYIHETIYESFVDALARATNSAAKDVVANVGPVQNYMQLKKLQALFEDICKRGYKIRTEQAGIRDGEGFYAFPTIVDNPPPDSTIVKEEHFGPVIPCIPFSDVDEAIRLANNTESGLAASIWTNQIELAEDIARRLEAGNIFINGPPQPDPFVPFGGHKQSGIGVEYGLEGLLSYCQIKSIYKYQ